MDDSCVMRMLLCICTYDSCHGMAGKKRADHTYTPYTVYRIP